MASCEKCWSDAYLESLGTDKSQHDLYLELIVKRKNNPCSPKDQAGQWWDEEKQVDTRSVNNA